MKRLIFKRIYIVSLLILLGSTMSISLHSQVTIGSKHNPAQAALLELKTQTADPSTNETTGAGGGGLVLPRVKLENRKNLMPFIADDTNFQANANKVKDVHIGLTVYNLTSNVVSESDADKRFRPGIYVWDGTQWNFVYEGLGQRYFYIPSANIPLSDASGNKLTGATYNLYDKIYKAQFTKAGNTTFVSSNPDLNFVPSPQTTSLYDAADLDYVVTYYDSNILKVNSISATGEISYDVLSLDTTPASFINVVFVIKEDKLK